MAPPDLFRSSARARTIAGGRAQMSGMRIAVRISVASREVMHVDSLSAVHDRARVTAGLDCRERRVGPDDSR
jgi:hypothetical protein